MGLVQKQCSPYRDAVGLILHLGPGHIQLESGREKHHLTQDSSEYWVHAFDMDELVGLSTDLIFTARRYIARPQIKIPVHRPRPNHESLSKHGQYDGVTASRFEI